MTATQDTNLTSLSLGQAKKGLLRIQALQEGSPGLWAQAAPLPPFLMASGGPSLLPLLTMKLVWGLGMSPNLASPHCLPWLTHIPQVLPPRFISQLLQESQESWAGQTPSAVNLPDLWRPALFYSSAPKLGLWMANTPDSKIPELVSKEKPSYSFSSQSNAGRRNS